MKKIITLCFIALTSVTLMAAETVVWQGTKVLGAEGNDAITLTTEDVAALELNDYIAVTITDLADTYCQLNIAGTNPWTSIPGTNWSDITEAGEHTYQVADEDLLQSILTGGLMIQGKLCTITKVTILHEDGESGEGGEGGDPDPEHEEVTLVEGDTVTLFEDAEGVAMSWNEICEQNAALGAQLAEKDKIIVTVSAKEAACEWPKVILRDATSIEVVNELLNDVSTFPHEVVFELTADEAAAVQEGFRISGDGVTITKVQAYKYKEEEPETLQPGEEKVLWEGSETLAWNEVAEQSAEVGALLAEKDQLIVTVSEKGTADWPKVLLRDASSNAVGEDILLNEVSEFPYDAVFTLTAADAAALADGFKVCGDGVTVTKLVLKKYKEDVDPVEPGEPYVDTEVWSGDVAISWNQEVYAGTELDTYDVQQDMFAGLSEGDSIKVYFTDAIEDAQFNLTYKAGENWDWTSLEVAQKDGFFTYKVASEVIAQDIADHGLVIRGQGYHVVRIVVGKPRDITSVVEINGQQPVFSNQRYNILGQPVDENYKGLVIMNGKKFFQQ